MFAPLGIDGFVREEATFELIQCDFSSPAIKFVSMTNTTPVLTKPDPNGGGRFPGPGGPGRGGPPPGGPGRKGPPGGQSGVYAAAVHWGFARAASWHHHTPDPRVHLQPQHLVSFYDTKYTSMLSTFSRPRIEHRLVDASSEDIAAFKKELAEVIDAWTSGEKGSGFDWTGLVESIVDRTADRLDEMRALLDASTSNTTAVLSDARALAYTYLWPYLSAPDTLSVWPEPPSTGARQQAMKQAVDLCQIAFTGHVEESLMTPQEKRLKGAVEGVLGRICGYYADLLQDALEIVDSHEKLDGGKERATLARWKKQTQDLMSWLDWPQWKRCPRQCDVDEQCFVPMFPLGMGGGPGRGGPGRGSGELEPKCVKRGEL